MTISTKLALYQVLCRPVIAMPLGDLIGTPNHFVDLE